MAYLPHAVVSSMGAAYGSIIDVKIVTSAREDQVCKYPIYLEISLVNVPNSRVLYGVRYYGRLRLEAQIGTTSNLFTGEAEGNHDALIEEALSAGVSKSEIELVVKQTLNGRIVNPNLMGGRWIVR